MNHQEYQYSCKIVLTDEDRVALFGEQVRLVRELDSAREDLKAHKDKFKERETRINNRLSEIVIAGESGHVYEDRPCFNRPNFPLNCMEIVRADTGEVVSSRALTASERQLALKGVDADEAAPGETSDDGADDEASADDTSAPSAKGMGTCPECGRRIKLSKAGELTAHGPKDDRCPGTGQAPGAPVS